MKKIAIFLIMAVVSSAAFAQNNNSEVLKRANTNFIAGYAFTAISLYSFHLDNDNRNAQKEKGLTMSNYEFVAIGSGIVAVVLFSNVYSDLKESNRMRLQVSPTAFKITYKIGGKKNGTNRRS